MMPDDGSCLITQSWQGLTVSRSKDLHYISFVFVCCILLNECAKSNDCTTNLEPSCFLGEEKLYTFQSD